MLNRSEQDSLFRSVALVFIVAIAVSIVGVAFDRLLVHEGVPRYDLMAIADALTGIVAGAFFWQLRRRERERRRFVRERLRTISEMNHHIRNALQVISYYSEKQQDQKAVEMLGQAVTRIEWALSEVLPGQLSEEPIVQALPQPVHPRIMRH
jgi:hypothetical protein